MSLSDDLRSDWEARPAPRALDEPTTPVSKAWIFQLGLGTMGLFMAGLTPLQLLLPKQVQHVAPHDKFLVIGLVHAFGAVAAIVATPLVGALSDRTTDARAFGKLKGRRHRWTIGCCVLAAICLGLLSVQNTVAGILGLWLLFSLFNNGQYASLSASIPDHVPVRQRATVAGWVGMPQAVGLVIGVLLVAKVFKGFPAGYSFLAVCMVLFILPFVFTTADYPLDATMREPFSARQLFEAFKVDLRAYPDFGWAWITRFLASLSISMGTLYLFYFLRDAVHYKNPTSGLTTLILIYTVCVVLTATIGGRISDRLGKRKMIVTVSGALMGAAALLLVFIETWHGRPDRGGAVRLRLRRLPGRRPGPDHPGTAQSGKPGQGPGPDQHRDRRAGGRRRPAVGAPGHDRPLPDPVRQHRRRRRDRRHPGLADQERRLSWPAPSGAASAAAAGSARRRPTRAIWRLWATRWPAESQTSASSSNQPPLTWRQRAATASSPGAGTRRMCMVSSTVGAQPVAPSPKTTGGRPSTAMASIRASGSRSSLRRKYPRISGNPEGSSNRQPVTAGSSSIWTWPA